MQAGGSVAPMGGHLGGPTRSRSDAADVGSSSAASVMAEASAKEGPMKVGDVFPDLHHKMSKKIAQLTKVIYHLNTKNEDRQARVPSRAVQIYSRTLGPPRHALHK